MTDALLGFDTETTGARPTEDRIVQVALVEQRQGTQRTRTWLADPGIPIPEGAARVHGITTERARAEGADRREVVEEVVDLLARAGSAGIPIVIFNAQFDLTLIEAEARRLSLPGVVERVGRIPVIIDPLVIDRTLDRYRRGKRNLEAMSLHYGVRGGEDLHDAAADVRQTLAVWEALVAAHPDLATTSADVLMELQRRGHAEWARGMNSWLAKRGRTPDVVPEWPLIPAAGQ